MWGSLSQLREAADPLIRSFAGRLQDRKLYKCADIRAEVHHRINPNHEPDDNLAEQVDECCEKIMSELAVVRTDVRTPNGIPCVLLDTVSRTACKTVIGPQSLTERINVKTEGGSLMDLRRRSRVVDSIGEFRVNRAYFDPDCRNAKESIFDVVEREIKECGK